MAPGSDKATGKVSGPPAHPSLRGFLVGYDREIGASLQRARAARSGLERVRALHNEVRPYLVVHDAVLEAALCPLLERLPGGPALADRLRNGCRERAQLLARFAAVSEHVAAHNVYPVAGEEVEQVLDGLERSFAAHAHDETAQVSELLASAEGASDPDAIMAAMALEARRAPTRHPWALAPPRSPLSRALRRFRDRVEDWSDTHWSWSDGARATGSPRLALVNALKRQADASPPSVRSVLEGYDAAVARIVAELRAARTPAEEARAAHRVAAAIAIHDAVVGGALCPLLEAVPGGEEAAARLRRGCLERATLQRGFEALAREASPEGLYLDRREAAEELMGELIARFDAHEREETLQVESLLGPLPDEAYRTPGSSLDDILWPWHSEGPSALALRMALWGESAPTRAHPALLRHPSSRVLRSTFHLVDHLQDRWGDTWLERWLFPDLPPRPVPGGPAEGGSAPPGATAAEQATGEEGTGEPKAAT